MQVAISNMETLCALDGRGFFNCKFVFARSQSAAVSKLCSEDHCASGQRKSASIPEPDFSGGTIRYQSTSASAAAWRFIFCQVTRKVLGRVCSFLLWRARSLPRSGHSVHHQSKNQPLGDLIIHGQFLEVPRLALQVSVDRSCFELLRFCVTRSICEPHPERVWSGFEQAPVWSGLIAVGGSVVFYLVSSLPFSALSNFFKAWPPR